VNRFICLLAFSLGCGAPKAHIEPVVSSDLRDALSAKAALYRSALSSVQDTDGFVDFDRCDSLLHSGLIGAVVPGVNLEAARAESGQWFRRPLSYDECFATGASRSTISRDMLLGVMWWAWKNGRLDVLEDLRNYGQDHDWIMGEADSPATVLGRAYLTPGFRGLLCRTIVKMGGSSHGDCLVPQVYGPVDDFEAHLQVLTILLEGEVSGGVSASAVEALQRHVLRQPQNPLFAAALSRFGSAHYANTAASLLLSSPTWPADRLPDSESACSPWPVMHDYGADYVPCPDRAERYSGGDLLFIAYVLGVL
jgi:hypothetical protein